MSKEMDDFGKQIDIAFGMVAFTALGAVLISLFLFYNHTNEPYNKPEKQAVKQLPYGIDVVTVDSCQYLTWQYGPCNAPAIAMVHKANCPNHGGKP